MCAATQTRSKPRDAYRTTGSESLRWIPQCFRLHNAQTGYLIAIYISTTSFSSFRYPMADKMANKGASSRQHWHKGCDQWPHGKRLKYISCTGIWKSHWEVRLNVNILAKTVKDWLRLQTDVKFNSFAKILWDELPNMSNLVTIYWPFKVALDHI